MASNVQEILNELQPSLLVLKDSRSIDRSAKRRAVQNLREKGLIQLKQSETAHAFLQETSMILFNCIAEDCVEKCREQCLEFVYYAFAPVTDASFALQPVVHLCSRRVLVNEKTREPAEESEEIRLELLRLLNVVLSRCSEQAIKPPIADDIFSVVQSCVNDKFPDAQKEACGVLLTLTKKKSTYVGYFGDQITKTVLPILRHKHAALRTLGIKVAECLVLTSTTALKPLVEVTDDYDKSIVETLAYDNSPVVREALARCSSAWLTSCSPLDRYKYADVLLPLLLTASVDEIDTVAQSGRDGLESLDTACTNDMIAARILPDASGENEIGVDAPGLSNLVHHTFKKSLQSFSHVLCISFNQQRPLSLKALRLFLQYAPREDIILELRKIITIIATVHTLETGSKESQKQLVNIVDVVSKTINNASFYLDILLPLASNASSTDGRVHPQTSIWVLSTFVMQSTPRAIQLSVLSRILDHFKRNNFSKNLLENGLSVVDACSTFYYAIRNYVHSSNEKLSEEDGYKGVYIGIQLLATCSITSENIQGNSLNANQIMSEPLSKAMEQVNEALNSLHKEEQPTEGIYAHYLPALIESFSKQRGPEPQKWNDETLPLHMLLTVLSHTEPQVLKDRGVMQESVSLLVKAGSLSKTERSGRDIDSSRLRARLRCVLSLTRLYELDKETCCLSQYSNDIVDDLFMSCMEMSEPHAVAGALAIQNKLRQRTLACLTVAMENNDISFNAEQQTKIEVMLIDNLQNRDEHTRQLSIAATVEFLKLHLAAGTAPMSHSASTCLQAMLSRANDDKRIVSLSLYTQLPSILGILPSDALQLLMNTVVSQIEYIYKRKDVKLLAAFQKLINALHSLDANRLIDTINQAREASNSPIAYETILGMFRDDRT